MGTPSLALNFLFFGDCIGDGLLAAKLGRLSPFELTEVAVSLVILGDGDLYKAPITLSFD